VGRGVVEILVRFFPEIINVDFTARMEDDLDRVAEGTQEWTALLREFYGVFKPMLDRAGAEAGKDTSFLNRLFTGDKACPKCGKPLAMKRSKFGAFLGCSGYPACDYTERIKTNARRSRYRSGKRPGRPSVQG